MMQAAQQPTYSQRALPLSRASGSLAAEDFSHIDLAKANMNMAANLKLLQSVRGKKIQLGDHIGVVGDYHVETGQFTVIFSSPETGEINDRKREFNSFQCTCAADTVIKLVQQYAEEMETKASLRKSRGHNFEEKKDLDTDQDDNENDDHNDRVIGGEKFKVLETPSNKRNNIVSAEYLRSGIPAVYAPFAVQPGSVQAQNRQGIQATQQPTALNYGYNNSFGLHLRSSDASTLQQQGRSFPMNTKTPPISDNLSWACNAENPFLPSNLSFRSDSSATPRSTSNLVGLHEGFRFDEVDKQVQEHMQIQQLMSQQRTQAQGQNTYMAAISLQNPSLSFDFLPRSNSFATLESLNSLSLRAPQMPISTDSTAISSTDHILRRTSSNPELSTFSGASNAGKIDFAPLNNSLAIRTPMEALKVDHSTHEIHDQGGFNLHGASLGIERDYGRDTRLRYQSEIRRHTALLPARDYLVSKSHLLASHELRRRGSSCGQIQESLNPLQQTQADFMPVQGVQVTQPLRLPQISRPWNSKLKKGRRGSMLRIEHTPASLGLLGSTNVEYLNVVEAKDRLLNSQSLPTVDHFGLDSVSPASSNGAKHTRQEEVPARKAANSEEEDITAGAKKTEIFKLVRNLYQTSETTPDKFCFIPMYSDIEKSLQTETDINSSRLSTLRTRFIMRKTLDPIARCLPIEPENYVINCLIMLCPICGTPITLAKLGAHNNWLSHLKTCHDKLGSILESRFDFFEINNDAEKLPNLLKALDMSHVVNIKFAEVRERTDMAPIEDSKEFIEANPMLIPYTTDYCLEAVLLHTMITADALTEDSILLQEIMVFGALYFDLMTEEELCVLFPTLYDFQESMCMMSSEGFEYYVSVGHRSIYSKNRASLMPKSEILGTKASEHEKLKDRLDKLKENVLALAERRPIVAGEKASFTLCWQALLLNMLLQDGALSSCSIPAQEVLVLAYFYYGLITQRTPKKFRVFGQLLTFFERLYKLSCGCYTHYVGEGPTGIEHTRGKPVNPSKFVVQNYKHYGLSKKSLQRKITSATREARAGKVNTNYGINQVQSNLSRPAVMFPGAPFSLARGSNGSFGVEEFGSSPVAATSMSLQESMSRNRYQQMFQNMQFPTIERNSFAGLADATKRNSIKRKSVADASVISRRRRSSVQDFVVVNSAPKVQEQLEPEFSPSSSLGNNDIGNVHQGNTEDKPVPENQSFSHTG